MWAAAARPPHRDTGVIWLSATVSAALSVVYLLWQPQTLDLAAQTFRADLWDRYGWVIYNDAWYGGHTIPGYSLLYPPLGAWLGPELLGAICAVAAAFTFAAIAVRAYGSRAWVGAVWFGLGSTVSLYGGRITFALGLALGLVAILALQRRRPLLGGLAGAAAGLASPVAGLFTVMAAAAVLIASRLEPIAAPSRAALTRAAWVVAIATALATLALALAFPTAGIQPFTTSSFLWVPIVCAVCFVLLPVGETTLRCGIVLYALIAIAAFMVATPFGGNAIRLGHDLRRTGDGAGALRPPPDRPAAARGAAALVAMDGHHPRRRRRRRRSGDRGGLLRAARQRAREPLGGRADPGRDPADPEPLGIRLRGRARTARPRLAAPARIRRLRPVHEGEPDRPRLREVVAGARRRLRRRARHLARLPRQRRGGADPDRRAPLPARRSGRIRTGRSGRSASPATRRPR